MKRPGRLTSPEYSEWIYLNICRTPYGIKQLARQMVTVSNLPGVTPKQSLEFHMQRMEETFCNRGLRIPQQIEDAINLELEWLDRQVF